MLVSSMSYTSTFAYNPCTVRIPHDHMSLFHCLTDYLHGLGRREGAGLRSGPNVFTKVPRFEGFLTLQVFSTPCKCTPTMLTSLNHQTSVFELSVVFHFKVMYC